MFGSMLVCPVTEPGVSSRKVYLPCGDGEADWIDFWSGVSYSPGQWIEADAPIGRIPLFVRGGSIILTTDPAEYADAQIGAPLTINVYPGRDATFDFYEDAGDGYVYESGESAVVSIEWDDASRTLRIGAQDGSYPGCPAVRKLKVRTPFWEKSVDYDGTPVAFRM